MGKAFVVPFRSKIENFEGLTTEALELWRAEDRTSNGNISSGWGTVALLSNPNSSIAKEIESNWTDFYLSRVNGTRIPVFDYLKSEGTPVSPNGILRINWPRMIANNQPLDLDVILATPTSAMLKNHTRYPSVKEIAKSYLDADYLDYFTGNLAHDVRTFQDDRIETIIEKASSQ